MSTRSWVLVVVAAVLIASGVTYTVMNRPARDVVAETAPVGSIRDLMEGMLDPASDVIFESVATVSTVDGIVERAPSTDDEWATVEHNALELAEAAALLRMPGRHVKRPDQPEPAPVPDAPQLTADQVEEKIASDPELWRSHTMELQKAAVEALTAARSHNVDALFNVGDEIDEACEQCHLKYWYPDQKPLLPK